MTDVKYIFNEDSGKIHKIKKIVDSPHDDSSKIATLEGISYPVLILILGGYIYVEDLYRNNKIEKKYFRAYKRGNQLIVSSKNSYLILEDDELESI